MISRAVRSGALSLVLAGMAMGQSSITAEIATKWGPLTLTALSLDSTRYFPAFQGVVQNNSSSDWGTLIAHFEAKTTCGAVSFDSTLALGLKLGKRKDIFDGIASIRTYGNECRLVKVISAELKSDNSANTQFEIAEAERLASEAEATRVARMPILSSQLPYAFVGSDMKCAIQFQQAMNMAGLEKRKTIDDLLQHHCGTLADNGAHLSSIKGASSIVHIVIYETLEEGWIPRSWIKRARP